VATSRYLVLSDIHLTVPHPWAAFRDQAALGACLEHLAAQPPPPSRRFSEEQFAPYARTGGEGRG